MDETGLVRVREPPRRLGRQLPRLVRRQPAPAGEEVGERLAVYVLHDDVRAAVVLARVVDADDVRVGEPRRELGLTDEPPPELIVAREVLRQQLDRHRPLELGVAPEVDRGHAAVPERPLDPVPASDRRGTHPGDFYPLAQVSPAVSLQRGDPIVLRSRMDLR